MITHAIHHHLNKHPQLHFAHPANEYDVLDLRDAARLYATSDTAIVELLALCDQALGYSLPVDTVPMAHTSVRRCPYPADLSGMTHFSDTSWGNDVYDSLRFAAGAGAYIVWVDAAHPLDRSQEWGWDPLCKTAPVPKRFTLCQLVDTEQRAPGAVVTLTMLLEECNIQDEPVLATDDPQVLLDTVRALASSQAGVTIGTPGPEITPPAWA